MRVRVVGITRGIHDLSAATGTVTSAIDQSTLLAGPAIAAAAEDAGGYRGVAIRAAGGAAAVNTAIERAFPGRPFNSGTAVGPEESEPIREAIDYEARAAWLFGLIAAGASVIFVSQAVDRQTRHEWSDLATLRALGLTRAEARYAAGLRSAATGGVAATIAGLTAIALSPFTPVGQGRRAEVDRGVAIDAMVVIAGTVAVLLVVTLAGVVSLRRGRRPTTNERTSRGLSGHGSLPVTAVAGLALTMPSQRQRRRGSVVTAIGGVAVAAATLVAADGLRSGLDTLTDTPAHYGALWDLSVTQIGGVDAELLIDVTEIVAAQRGVEAAAAIVGTDVVIGDEMIWVQAHRPLAAFDGIPPVITDGREPAAIDEIALGAITMRNLGVEAGDTIVVSDTVRGQAEMTMTVVGTAIINDTYEGSPGRGGIVTVDWIEANSPEASADPVVLRLDAGADVAAVRDEIERQSTLAASPPAPHTAIRNIERIAALPWLLAAVVAGLAVASLGHALDDLGSSVAPDDRSVEEHRLHHAPGSGRRCLARQRARRRCRDRRRADRDRRRPGRLAGGCPAARRRHRTGDAVARHRRRSDQRRAHRQPGRRLLGAARGPAVGHQGTARRMTRSGAR